MSCLPEPHQGARGRWMFPGLRSHHFMFPALQTYSITTSYSFVEVFFLGRITTICQMISGIQKPVIKNVLHMDKEPDRLTEKRK